MNQPTNRHKELLGLTILPPTLFGVCLGIIAGAAIATLIEEASVWAAVKSGAIAGTIALAISVIMIWLIPTGEGFAERYEPVTEFTIGTVIGTLVTIVAVSNVAATGFVSAYIAGTIVLGVVGVMSLGIFSVGTYILLAIAKCPTISHRWFVPLLIIPLSRCIFYIGTDAMSAITIGSITALQWFVAALVIKWTVLFFFDFV